MQVYRGMDIGTAKPGLEITNKLPHHLIDIRNPSEQFNAGDFVHESDGLIPSIIARGKIPIVAGGTPFYFRNFIYGLPETPPGNETVRHQIRLDIEKNGLPCAYAELERLDPAAAKKISASDRYRIERALEVIHSSGKPFSTFQISTEERKGYKMLQIGLNRTRDDLYARIKERVIEMFSRGLVKEVAGLMSDGYTASAPGMRGIGYKEFFSMRVMGCVTVDMVRNQIILNSRRYAKRQMTFFRSFLKTSWFHADDISNIEKLVDRFVT